MAINYSYPSGTPTDNDYLNSLIWGGSLSAGADQATTITWAAGGSEYAYFDSTRVWTDAWSSTELTALQSAFQQWSNVCNITFTQVTDGSATDFREFKISSASMRLATTFPNVVASHEVPGDSQYATPLYGFYNEGLSEWTSGLQQGSAGFKALIHELGHGLGLAHPHDGGSRTVHSVFPGVTERVDVGDYGDYDLNQGIWTVMSYNDGWLTQPTSGNSYGSEGTPMAFDIAAIQYIYGANTSFHTGTDTYQLASSNASGTYWSCIWDAGGTDTISAYGLSLACTINLNAAPLTGANAAGYVSYASGITGGYTIANNVTIENATGGNAADTLVGNSAVNQLDGEGGADTLTGGDGKDVFVYAASGNGVDTITDFAVGDIIRVTGSSFSEAVTSGDGTSVGVNQIQFASSGGTTTLYIGTDSTAGADVVIQITGTIKANQFSVSGTDVSIANPVSGTNTNDSLTGTELDEVLDGGDGNDTLDGGEGSDVLEGGSGKDKLTGGTGDDSLSGGDGVDNLSGGEGDDTLDGGTGNDKMAGGAGEDTYYVDAKGDTATEKTGEGTDTVISSISYTLGKEVENLELGGADALSGVGNKSSNTLTGNDGANTLNGKDGNDTLTGGAGADTFVFDIKLNALTNIDNISDFVSAADVINLSKKIFTAYKSTASGAHISDADFVSEAGATAHDKSDHFLYDTSTGYLYYDADGSGAKAAVQFATLAGVPSLTAGDLTLI